MKLFLTLIFFPFCVGLTFGQCRLLTQTGSYEATCFQKLYDGKYQHFGPEVSIARNGKSGYFILKKSFSMETEKFKGKVYIYLDDGSMITLIDRGVQWKVNQELFGQYNLTESEIKRLKESNISAIRYWACFSSFDCDNADEYYNKDFVDQLLNTRVSRTNFRELVDKLYNQ